MDKTIMSAMQDEVEKLIEERESLKKQISERQSTAGKIGNEIRSLRHDIEVLHVNDRINVTDHAVLRYAERVMGLDVTKIKEVILSERLRKYIDGLGNGKFPIADGFKAVVQDRTVVTILED